MKAQFRVLTLKLLPRIKWKTLYLRKTQFNRNFSFPFLGFLLEEKKKLLQLN